MGMEGTAGELLMEITRLNNLVKQLFESAEARYDIHIEDMSVEINFAKKILDAMIPVHINHYQCFLSQETVWALNPHFRQHQGRHDKFILVGTNGIRTMDESDVELFARYVRKDVKASHYLLTTLVRELRVVLNLARDSNAIYSGKCDEYD